MTEEGRWRLNDPVSRYVPGFAGLKVHAGDRANGEPLPSPAFNQRRRENLGGAGKGSGMAKLRIGLIDG